MRTIFKTIVIVSLLLDTNRVKAQWLDPYLPEDQIPDATAFLPGPPDKMSGEFYNDFYYYNWGKEQRNDAKVAADAIYNYLHEDFYSLEDYMANAMNMELSHEATPCIDSLLRHTIEDAYVTNKRAKKVWNRKRPFVVFNEPSIYPETDKEEAESASYPSGHATSMYSAAQTLIMVAPEKAEEIMAAADKYCLERVICGHHFKSDIDASFKLVTITMLKLHSSSDFLSLLGRARQEYLNIATGISDMKKTEKGTSSIYSLSGMEVGHPSKNEIYIENGKKRVTAQ